LRDFVGRTPDCATNPLCSTVDRVLEPVDTLQQTLSQTIGSQMRQLTDYLAEIDTQFRGSIRFLPARAGVERPALQHRPAPPGLREWSRHLSAGLRRLDTLVVRALITPSVVALLGRWFWWPRGMARVVTRG